MIPENQQVPEVKKENNFLRLLCAVIIFFVVFEHCRIDSPVTEYIVGIGRFAMPIFLMLSGYYIFSNDGHSEKRLPQKTIRILALLIILKLLYLAIDIVYCCFGVYTIEYVIHGFLIWTDYNTHAWFLYSLFGVYMFWLILAHFKIDYRKTYILVPIVLVIDLLFAEFLPMFGMDTVKIGESTYPFIGIPFFIMGYIIHRHRDRIEEIFSNAALWIMIVLGTVLSAIGTALVPTSNLFVGSVMLAFAIFVGSFRIPSDRLRCRPLEYVGRHLVVWIYVIHAAIIQIFALSFTQLSGQAWFIYSEPLIVSIISLVIAEAIHLSIRHRSQKKRSKRATQSVS